MALQYAFEVETALISVAVCLIILFGTFEPGLGSMGPWEGLCTVRNSHIPIFVGAI